MSAPAGLSSALDSAAERSAVYRTLAQGFTYAGAQAAPFNIQGADFNEAFDPSISDSACSLREGQYTEEDQSALFEELMRFYSFFGLARGDGAEMPDHLSVELEFMHYLTHLESQAAAAQEAQQALDSLHRAQRDFLARHVQRVVQGLAGTLKSQDPACQQLVHACADFIDAELAHTQDLVNDQKTETTA